MNRDAGMISVVERFNEMINTGDLPGLTLLMTEDHTFTDSSGTVHRGRELMVSGWKDFFGLFPDYRNHFSSFRCEGDMVFVSGHSFCSFRQLDGPALWAARITGGKVSLWQVYRDTATNRKKLGM